MSTSMPSQTTSGSPFLNLPPCIRRKILDCLLSPHPDEQVTTINYALEWPYLENPTNTTFAGPTQIDICTCHRENDSCHEDKMSDVEETETSVAHIYTRYRCHAPGVQFKSPADGLWFLQSPNGPVNVLRPASAVELARRPRASLLRTCKQIYAEALPFLYSGRTFMFLTGPCPRGRYQAYATLEFLKTLSPVARTCIEYLSLLIQQYEEDCVASEARTSYAELTKYIGTHLPAFRKLYLNICSKEMISVVEEFKALLQRGDVSIVVSRDTRIDEYQNMESFVETCAG